MENENKVIALILEGKTDYYAEIMNRYHNELFKYAYNIVGDYTTTEDLVQEIFIRIYNQLSKYNKDKASFRTWMYRVASNYVTNYVKSKAYLKQKSLVYDEDYLLVSDEDIEEKTVRDDQLNRIVVAIKKLLKQNHQEIMYLHFFSGLEVKEIAEILELSDKTVYKAIKTSIEKIKMEVSVDE